ncbi:hypothetical protein PV08_00856 [Exophiala spinifera]|uniref:N-acetyltransferase domain-containing protein n=1 Tax=Exophiala spinifera TaxID=91928 RepID=A0A0D1YYB7_9EURO|nr:uncharacterized protein PV08_00856 [Exophiala spinifera]KIW20281.1 hypothetical protein PV08_00856 [Exophiala spinifera]
MKTTRPIFPAPAPPIKTPRLLLRPVRQSDLSDFHILRTQTEVMMWTSSGKPDVDEQATQIWLNRFLPPNDATTFNFAVEELSVPGKVIGVMGCHIAEPPEVGYMFVKEAWGMGYATEAVQAWLQAYWRLPRKEVVIGDDVNDDTFIPETLKADVDRGNMASVRILARCGFLETSEELIEEHGQKVNVVHLALRRPE